MIVHNQKDQNTSRGKSNKYKGDMAVYKRGCGNYKGGVEEGPSSDNQFCTT